MEYKNYFEHLGYFKEYYIADKFIGFLKCEKDREVMGYNGRKKEIINEPVFFEKNKTIKAGTEVMTIVYPLCGKMIGK